MLIAKVQNGVVTKVGDYRELFPNVSFPTNGPDADFLTSNGCLMVNVWKPFNTLTQKLVNVNPYIDGGQVFTVNVDAMSVEEIALAKSQAMDILRSQRNALLAACDWTQLADNNSNKAVWATYRQTLRDFPATVLDARTGYTFPATPV